MQLAVAEHISWCWPILKNAKFVISASIIVCLIAIGAEPRRTAGARDSIKEFPLFGTGELVASLQAGN
jgi:hypothetical protein